jgi:hypothetical protein
MNAALRDHGAGLTRARLRAQAHLERDSPTGPEAHELYWATVISALRAKIADRERRVPRSRHGAQWRGY